MRLDEYLYKNNYFDSRTKAVQSIKRGEIYLNDVKITKPSFFIDQEKRWTIKKVLENEFVSLGGYKLNKALKDFNFVVKDLVCADIGASTGGFTDCLLINGAKKIFAVDLNDTLLHDKLKKDSRVKSIIKNAKELNSDDFELPLDFICADLSFISATAVLKVLYSLLTKNKTLIILIKPQFENDKKINVKNGIIREEKLRKESCLKIYQYAIACGFSVKGLTVAPINKEKNIEYLLLLEKSDNSSIDFDILFNNCYKF